MPHTRFPTHLINKLHSYRDAKVRDNFSIFLERAFRTVSPGTRYRHNWHLEVLADRLMAAAAGDITRLIINVPPRSLKSVTVSVAWPAFLMGHDPTMRIMAASYSQHLASKHSLDCRAIMQSRWYQRIFSDTILARDQNEKHKFATTQQGHRIATSVGGTATGEGGRILIVDDPLSAAQGLHAPSRNAANHWFDTTFATRLDDKEKGAIILVMQRLHEDDLTGHLLKKGEWEHVCLPAIAEKTERFFIETPINYGYGARPVAQRGSKIKNTVRRVGGKFNSSPPTGSASCSRYTYAPPSRGEREERNAESGARRVGGRTKQFTRFPGEALHPKRESVKLLNRAKRELGSRTFAAQYQQAPVAAEGGMVKLEWFVRFDVTRYNIHAVKG